ncbi:MAG: hypothetical protein LBQ14_09295 [Treponema sp.]|jgi:hypothetical protein|nr:hypothetical protein [Treponema sp.]
MKNILFCSLAFFAVLPLCFSCAVSGPTVQKALGDGETRVPARTVPPEEAVSLEESFDSGYWVTRPRDGAITIFGIAGRRGNRVESIREALADAACKAALYHGVHAESVAVLNQGSGNLDYFSDFDYRIEPVKSHEAYIDVLAFDEDKDILEKNGAVIVMTRYVGVSVVPPYESRLEEGVPVWTKNHIPAIPGFLAGVGHSRNRGSLQKTCAASYEAAIVSLLPLLSVRVSSEVIDSDGAGAGKLTSNVTNSEGDLVNVMILETWVEKNTNSIWTLIAAKAK